MIDTVKKTCFVFTTTVNGTTYNFQKFAEDEAAARSQVIADLKILSAEFEEVKAGTKAN
jgi:hypothetical protein